MESTMKKIGITGQQGFIGSHLYNYLALDEDLELITFNRSYFEDEKELQNFVASCDCIIHLAAMNRHKDPQVIYDTNISLVEKLISACDAKKVTPHIIFSSSTQEDRDNLYGQSKKKGGELLKKWSNEKKGKSTSLVIPNAVSYTHLTLPTICSV